MKDDNDELEQLAALLLAEHAAKLDGLPPPASHRAARRRALARQLRERLVPGDSREPSLGQDRLILLGAGASRSESPDRTWRALTLAAVVTLAAAMLVFMLWPAHEPTRIPGVEPLATRYQLELFGAESTMRSSASTERPAFRSLGELELLAQPQEPVSQAVELRVFAFDDDGVGRRLAIEAERLRDGALRVRGRVGALLPLPPGDWTLAVVIGTAGALSDEPEHYRPGADLDGVAQVSHRPIRILSEALAVSVRGCELRRKRPCVVEPGARLTIWVDHPMGQQASLSIDGREVRAEDYAIDGERGHGFELSAPKSGGVLSVQVPEPAFEPWTLALSLSDEVSTETFEASQERYRGHQRRAFEAQRRQAWDEAASWRRSAMDEALESGAFGRGIDAGVAAVYVLAHKQQDTDAARRLLAELRPVAASNAMAQAKLAYYEGVVWMTEGRVQDAAEAYLRASRVARRLRDRELSVQALPMFGLMMLELGRYEQAVYWTGVGAELAETGHPCDLAANLRNAGWSRLLLRASGREAGDPVPLLERAHAIYSAEGACADPGGEGSSRVSLAIAHAEASQWRSARRWLAEADDTRLTDLERLWAADVSVRAALAEEPTQVDAALARMGIAAESVSTPEARWRLALRRGQGYEARGEPQRALASYREAEGVLDELAGMVVLGFGRDLFLAQRSASVHHLVDLLLREGDARGAVCAARLGRLRWQRAGAGLGRMDGVELAGLRRQYYALRDRVERASADRGRSVGERRAVMEEAGRALTSLRREVGLALGGIDQPLPSCEELRSPDEGELVLVLQPLEGDSVALLEDRHGIRWARGNVTWDEPELAGLEELLRELLPPELDHGAGHRLRVLGSGAAAAAAVHRITWQGQPLGLVLPVSYSIDLPDVDVRSLPERERMALLVGDGTGTLGRDADQELVDVSTALRRLGWSTTLLLGDQVTARSLRRHLGEVSLFHYVGHAEHEHDGAWSRDLGPELELGRRGWSSALVLGGERLEATDILMLGGPMPEAVVLMGCETGVVDPSSTAGGMSLATAFLHAGARQVLAASDRIDDHDAAVLGRALNDGLGTDEGIEPAIALHRALRAARHTISIDEWAKLRVWER